MPELPEVETTLRAIKKFKGSLLKEAKVHNRNLRWKVVDSFETSVKDQVVESLERRAKYIIFKLSNDKKIILHLGMSGSLRIAKNNPRNIPIIKETLKSFKVTTVAPNNLGKLVNINSKSINTPCYILLLIC